MTTSFEYCYQAIGEWAVAHGIQVREEALPPGKAGEFDGILVRMNRAYDAEERSYYLAHALGSIILWSLNKTDVAQLFIDLRDAKTEKAINPIRFEAALGRYRDFEIAASELAVSLLNQLGQCDKVPRYTNFMWADLGAMTEFHRTDTAPVWSTFLERWNSDVASGRRQVMPFGPKAIPPFQPLHIERQEILQRQPSDP